MLAILREVLLHALVDARAHILRQVDALHAHVDQLDAEIGDASLALAEHSPVTAARSAVTICCSVRCATTLLMPSLTISARRSPASPLAAAGRLEVA